MADREVFSTPRLICSPLPQLDSELGVVEEEKTSPSQEFTGNPNVSTTIAHKIISEFMGTYVIIFAGCGAVLIDKRDGITIVGVAVVWGLVVMVMIYTLGHVSGANFNPAVTIAFAVSSQIPWKHVPTYILSQVMGSTAAILTLEGLLCHQVHIEATGTRFLYPTTHLEALAWEFIISFFLMFTVCGIATDHRAINELSGVGVGGIVLVNVLVAGHTTGASMNPARSIGPAIVSRDYHNVWIYIIGPILGTVAATMTYSLLRLPMANKSEKDGTRRAL